MQKKALGERFPKIEGVGCFVPRKEFDTQGVVSLFRQDLETARTLAGKEDPGGSFARKAVLIESAMTDFKKRSNGSSYTVGYEPGLKYPYPGLPIDFLMMVDPAIRGIIDTMAMAGPVAMTGLCCAGHPSFIMENPYFDPEEQGLGAAYLYFQGQEFSVHTHNQSPYFTLLLHDNLEGRRLRDELLRVSGNGSEKNASISIEAAEGKRSGTLNGFKLLQTTSKPELTIRGERPDFDEAVHAYQNALASFWSGILDMFSRLTGKGAPEPKSSDFTPGEADWDFEHGLTRIRASRGLTLPNYCYFFGSEATVEPVFKAKTAGKR